MSDYEDAIRAYVEAWRPRLGLTDWRIECVFGPAPDGMAAEIVFIGDDYDHARINFVADVSGWADVYAEEIVVHELVHALLVRQEQVFDDVRSQIHPDASDVAQRQYQRAAERAVERLAWSLVALRRASVFGWAEHAALPGEPLRVLLGPADTRD